MARPRLLVLKRRVGPRVPHEAERERSADEGVEQVKQVRDDLAGGLVAVMPVSDFLQPLQAAIRRDGYGFECGDLEPGQRQRAPQEGCGAFRSGELSQRRPQLLADAERCASERTGDGLVGRFGSQETPGPVPSRWRRSIQIGSRRSGTAGRCHVKPVDLIVHA